MLDPRAIATAASGWLNANMANPGGANWTQILSLGTETAQEESDAMVAVHGVSQHDFQTIYPMTMPLACVIGDMDLVRPLGLAGIPCAVVSPPWAPPRYSRFSRAVLDWIDSWEQPEELVDRLMGFGATQSDRPVLFYEEDGDLLLISRYRDRLAKVFRFVVPEPTLVEDLVDKARFQALAK